MSKPSTDLARIRNPYLVLALRRSGAGSHRKAEATRRQEGDRIIRHHLVDLPRARGSE